MSLALYSPAFPHGQAIPSRYSCDGEDLSPPLSWTGVPPTTETFALIMDDPDAPKGTWIHWVLYNIPAKQVGLPEGQPREATLPDGSIQGGNSWSRLGYGGPCPPSGTHRYYFKLYALDVKVTLPPGATKDQLLAAMKGHIVAETSLMGTYHR